MMGRSKTTRGLQKRILIIDDDDDLRDLISWALDQEGFEVQSYACPALALDNLRQGINLPQLIVVDFQMDAMRGTEFLHHKKKILLNSVHLCPVVMISASPEEIQSDQAELFKEIMTKPIDLDSLIFNIKSYV